MEAAFYRNSSPCTPGGEFLHASAPQTVEIVDFWKDLARSAL
jgi:hypothetical protein